MATLPLESPTPPGPVAGAAGDATADSIRGDRLAAYHREGYIGPIPIFTPDQCELISRHFRNDFTRRKAHWNKGWAAIDRLYHDVATRPAVLQPLREIIGDDVILWGASIIARVPGQVHPWHSDIESCSSAGGFVSLWIGLEHTCLDSSLQFITRSHRFGKSVQEVRYDRRVRRAEASDEDLLAWAREFDPEATLAEPDVHDGEGLIFDGRIWHGSKNTHAGGRRLALLLQYAAADRPIRQIRGHEYNWPFQLDEENLPPVIAVSGKPHPGRNRIVEPPRRTKRRGEAVRSERHPIRLPLELEPGKDWSPHRLLHGPTPNVPAQHAHVSILAPGQCPHPPHVHLDEEILIVLDGDGEILVGKGEDRENVEVVPMRPGSFAYYPSYQAHTIRNVGTGPLHYLMFRWSGEPWEVKGALPLTIHHTADAEAAFRRGSMSYAVKRLMQGPTNFLGRLHMHLSVMEPGGGYKPHRDRHDVAIILMSGRLEADGKGVEPFDMLYHAAGERHGLRNAADAPARYLVFEFERPGGGPGPGEERASERDGRRRRRRPKVRWRKFLPRWARRWVGGRD